MSNVQHSWTIEGIGLYVKITDFGAPICYIPKNRLVVTKLDSYSIQINVLGKNLLFKIDSRQVTNPVSTDADDLVINISPLIYHSFEDDISAAIAAAILGLWNDRGNFNASGGAYPSTGGSGTAGAIKKGDIWTISVAGTLPIGQVVEAGDTVRALTDTPGNTQANWAIAQNNIGYIPENTSNKDTDGTLAANSDTKYASQKATKTYSDTKIPLTYVDTDVTLAANSDTKIASQKAAKTYTDNSVSDKATYLAPASLTINNAGTTTINAQSKTFSTFYSSSSATSTTIAYSNINSGATVTWDYLKTTATNMVMTFPAGTVISPGSTVVITGGGLVANFSSTTSGRFHITIENINGTYKVFITQDVA